uniref:Uncharacterized protein n=1 Tax=Oryzias latipes TaxID=8090 RepID=A0A3P9GZ66_ORYLA
SDLCAINFRVSAPAEDINGDGETRLANLVIFQFHRYWFIVGLNGLFILSVTTDSLESMFRDTGIMGDMNITLWPMLSCTCMASRFCSLRSLGFFLLKLIRACWHPVGNLGKILLCSHEISVLLETLFFIPINCSILKWCDGLAKEKTQEQEVHETNPKIRKGFNHSTLRH